MVPLTSDYVDTSTNARHGTARQEPSGGLRSPAPSAVPTPGGDSRWQRFRENVWSPVLLKAGGACLGLSCLALAGAASMRQPSGGVPVTAQGTEWLAGEEPKVKGAAAGGGARRTLPGSSGSPARRAGPPPAPGASAGARAKDAADGALPCADGAAKKEKKGHGVAADGRIILNLADLQELTRLPGIGERRAEQIVALRERLGKFRRVTDLLRVKGIGPKSLRRLTPLLVLDPPVEAEGEAAAP